MVSKVQEERSFNLSLESYDYCDVGKNRIERIELPPVHKLHRHVMATALISGVNDMQIGGSHERAFGAFKFSTI